MLCLCTHTKKKKKGVIVFLVRGSNKEIFPSRYFCPWQYHTHQHLSFLIGAVVAGRKAKCIKHFCPSNAQRDASPFTLSSLQICLEKMPESFKARHFST